MTNVEDAVRNMAPRSRIIAGVIARLAEDNGGSVELTRAEIAELAGLAPNEGSYTRVSRVTAELAKAGLIERELRDPQPNRYTPVAGLAEATSLAVDVPGLSPGEAWVLMNISKTLAEGESIEKAEMAKRFGISARTLSRTIENLEFHGSLIVERDGRGRWVGYRIPEGVR